MAQDSPALAEGDEYIVRFKGGPFDGQTESRISTDGSWDAELTVLVGQEGQETLLNYEARAVSTVGGELHVLYVWDQDDSEPFVDPEVRWDYDI